MYTLYQRLFIKQQYGKPAVDRWNPSSPALLHSPPPRENINGIKQTSLEPCPEAKIHRIRKVFLTRWVAQPQRYDAWHDYILIMQEQGF